MRKLWLIGIFVQSCLCFSLDYSIEKESFWLSHYRKLANSPLNPNNQIARVSRYQLTSDIRPTFFSQITDEIGITLSPRLLYTLEQTQVSGTSSTQGLLDAQLYEAFAKWLATETLSFTVGLQNFQWGPAELIGPSNPLFHFVPDQRSVVFRQRGIALIKTTWTFSDNYSLVALVEPLHNDERFFVAEDSFTPRGLVKVERTLTDSANYFGISFGRMEQKKGFVGEYFNYYLTDGISLYADARHSRGSLGYYPQASASPVQFTQSRFSDSKIETLLIGGVRYEGEIDARLEYLYDSSGYTNSEFDLARASALQLAQSISRFSQPGLEFLLRHFLYLSIRSDTLGVGDSFRIALRYIHALQEGSGIFLFPIEWSFSNSLTTIIESRFSHGGRNSLFRLAADWEVLAGIRWAL